LSQRISAKKALHAVSFLVEERSRGASARILQKQTVRPNKGSPRGSEEGQRLGNTQKCCSRESNRHWPLTLDLNYSAVGVGNSSVFTTKVLREVLLSMGDPKKQ
jgi:hypothetical protein